MQSLQSVHTDNVLHSIQLYVEVFLKINLVKAVLFTAIYTMRRVTASTFTDFYGGWIQTDGVVAHKLVEYKYFVGGLRNCDVHTDVKP